MIVKLLTEHHLELLNLKEGCRRSSKSTHAKIPHCLKSHATAQFKYTLTKNANHSLIFYSFSGDP